MKQVEQNYRSGALHVVETPAPRCGDGQVLVRTRVSLISSGTERQLLELAKASLAGKAMARPDLVRRVIRNVRQEGVAPTLSKVFAKLDTPIPLGYSIAGEVLEVGRKVTGLAVGDRVACAGAGYANHAEINAIPKNLVVRIPDGVDDENASFVTLGAIALQGVRIAAPTLGERIVVMGLGLIGLLTAQLLKANGCSVLGFDPNPARAELARQLGVDIAISERLPEAVNAFTRGQGADAVIVAASAKSSEPINIAAELCRLKARIVVVGMVGMAIDREPFYKRELELKLSMSYGPGRHDPSYEQAGNDYPFAYVRWTEQRNMESFLELVAQGRVTPAPLVTHRHTIADAQSAYGILERNEPHLAILLDYPKDGAAPLERAIARGATPKPAQGGVGFIGFGNYAKGVLMPALKQIEGVRLTSVATATGLSARHAAEKHGFATAATDNAAVLADAQTDIVFIATRHDTHADLAAQALAANKHVFCEKPLATDAEGLSRVLAAAQTTSGSLTVGFNRRYAPMMQQIKAALSPRSGPLVMLYRINAGHIPADSWIQQAEGGGRIIGEMCHFIDALTYLAGAAPVEAQAITAQGLADSVSVLLRFADGSTGTIVYSSLGDPAAPKEYCEVFAQGLVAQMNDFRQLTITRGGASKTSKGAQDKGQRALVAAFIKAAREGAPAPIAFDEIVAVTQATFAVEDSLRLGAAVDARGASDADATS